MQVNLNADIPSMRDTVEVFLPHIRFLAMTAEEFLDKVSSSGVLTSDECVAILMNIRGLKHPLPQTFKLDELAVSKVQAGNLITFFYSIYLASYMTIET